eukprot:4913874-Pyramimonas_sp.AAC.1
MVFTRSESDMSSWPGEVPYGGDPRWSMSRSCFSTSACSRTSCRSQEASRPNQRNSCRIQRDRVLIGGSRGNTEGIQREPYATNRDLQPTSDPH